MALDGMNKRDDIIQNMQIRQFIRTTMRGEPMSKIAASDLRKDIAEVLNKVAYGHERIILQRHGKDAAVIIPLEDLALLESLEDHIDLQDAQDARDEAREQGTKSLHAFIDELSQSR